ncbi:MAG: hypothetical protein ABI744_05415, partial [Chloroflexota bacterium]
MTGGSEGIAGERATPADGPATPAAAPLTPAATPAPWDTTTSAAAPKPTNNHHRLIAVSLVLFVFTSLTYFMLGSGRTPYDFQLSQANNIVHGHLDMTEEYTHNL